MLYDNNGLDLVDGELEPLVEDPDYDTPSIMSHKGLSESLLTPRSKCLHTDLHLKNMIQIQRGVRSAIVLLLFIAAASIMKKRRRRVVDIKDIQETTTHDEVVLAIDIGSSSVRCSAYTVSSQPVLVPDCTAQIKRKIVHDDGTSDANEVIQFTEQVVDQCLRCDNDALPIILHACACWAP